MTRITLFSLAILSSLCHLASAGDDGWLVRGAMERLEKNHETVKKKAVNADDPYKPCRQSLEEARKLKMPEVPAWETLCKDIEHAALAHEAATAAADTYNWNTSIGFMPGHFSAANLPRLKKSAEDCIAKTDRALTEGAPATLVAEFGRRNVEIALGDFKTKICKPLSDMIEKYGADPEGMQRARWEEKAKPYRAVGIKGDRLDLLVDHIDYAMYAVGGRELTTPKQLKAAKIIFEMLSNDDGWTVRRYVFKGNKLVSTTSKSYLLKPGAKAFR